MHPEPVMTAVTGSATGYLHAGYARSLAEFGMPRELAHSGGWLLERAIPGTDSVDAMGCYPLFACRDWSLLHRDLDGLDGRLITVAVVADPFGNYDRQLLDRCFDSVTPFKKHFVADLAEGAEIGVSKHHRSYALKALRDVSVRVCHDPLELLDDWVSLYRNLTEKHGLSGIRAFSRASFEQQLAVPGMVALRAEHQSATVAANLFYIQGETAYDHLTASSAAGYRLRASYALKWCAIQHFLGKVRWIDWGGGAGAADDESDGLAMFKKGWAKKTRLAYFCSRILNKTRYDEIVKVKRLEHSRYFPAYREGEFALGGGNAGNHIGAQ